MASRSVATAIGSGPGEGEARDLQVAPTTAESKRIAGLVGPTLIALIASEALNYRIWNHNPASVTYLNGALLFVGGVFIVRVHYRWTRGWPLLFFGPGPDVRPRGSAAGRNAVTDGLLLAMFASGVVLTSKAYCPEGHRR